VSMYVTPCDSLKGPVRGWCNRQHDSFWPCYWGFESSPPSQWHAGPLGPACPASEVLEPAGDRAGSRDRHARRRRRGACWRRVRSPSLLGLPAPSSSGPGHHPLKVETRVRIPLGLLRLVRVHRGGALASVAGARSLPQRRRGAPRSRAPATRASATLGPVATGEQLHLVGQVRATPRRASLDRCR
jgi:hypothetical protein